MMTETFKNTFEPLILILGIGEDSKKYIDEIKGWRSLLVSAKMFDRDYTGPGGGIEMAILIITENVDATILAKNLKQSGLLTIIVATCEIRAMEGSYDSMAKVPTEKLLDTIMTVTEILIGPMRYICLDINDMCYVLRNSESFQAFTLKSSLTKGGVPSLVNVLKRELKDFSKLEKMIVKISVSEDDRETIKIADLHRLRDFLNTLPKGINVLWSLDISEQLQPDDLTVNVIATEKSRKV